MPDKRVDVDIDGLVYTIKVPDGTTQDQIYSWAEKQKNSREHKTQAGRKLFNSLQSERYKKEFPDADPQTIQLAVAESRQGVGGGEIARRANLRTNVNREVADRGSVDTPLSALRYGLKAVNETVNRGAYSALTGKNYDETQGGSYYGKLANLAPQSAIGRGLKSVDNAAQQKGWAGAPARLVQGFLEPGSLATLAAGPALGGASAITKEGLSAGLALGANAVNRANLGMQGADFAGSLPFLASDPQRFFESNLLNAAQGASAIGRRAPLSTKDVAYNPKFQNEQGVAGLAGLNPDAELLSAIKRAGREEAMANARTDIPQPTTLTAPAPQFAKPNEYAPLSTMNKGGGKKGKVKSSPDDMLAELDARLQAERASNAPPVYPKLPSLPDPNPGFFGEAKVSTKGVPPQIPDQPKFRNIGEGLPLEPVDTTPSKSTGTYTPPPPQIFRKTQGNGTANTANLPPTTPTGGSLLGWMKEKYAPNLRDGEPYLPLKTLYTEAKKERPGLTREEFTREVYELHKELDTTGRTGEIDWIYPSANFKKGDVFSAKADDGRTIRYMGVRFRDVSENLTKKSDKTPPPPTHEWNLSNGEKVPVRVVEDLGDGTAAIEADGKILTHSVKYEKLTPLLRLQSGLDPTGGKFDNSEPLLNLPQLFGKKKGQETPPKFDPTEDVDRESLAASITGKKKPTDLLPVNPESPKTSSKKSNKYGDAGGIARARAELVGTPHSVAEPDELGARVLSEGALERAVKDGNRGQEATVRAAEARFQTAKTDVMDRISRGERFIEDQNRLIKEEAGGRKNLKKVTADLIRRIEMKRTDDARYEGASERVLQLLRNHDDFMEEYRKYIIDNPVTGEALDKNFGITETGYFPHQSEGRYILKTKEGGFVGRFKTRKAATEYANQNGGKENYAPLDIEEQGEFFGNYISERKNTGALMKREGTAIAYEKLDYGNVLNKYVNRVTNAIETTKLKRDIEPFLEQLDNNDLGGVAERYRQDIEALSGKTSRAEDLFSDWVQRQSGTWKTAFREVEDPQYALRHVISSVNKVQNLLKLAYVPKNLINNAIQPLSTLLPYVKSADFVKAYKLALSPSFIKLMNEKGVGRDAVKNLELDSSLAGRAEGVGKWFQKNNLQTIGSQFSARVGYAYGHLRAMDIIEGRSKPSNLTSEQAANLKGLSEQERADLAHRNGMAWKEKVEYDSSTWNIPPALRGWLSKALLQYKSYAIKNMEEAFNYARRQEGQSRAEFAGQMVKGFGIRGALAGTKGMVAGKVIAMALAPVVNAMLGKDASDEEKLRTAEQLYLGLGNQLQADLSTSFGYMDTLYGKNPIEQGARMLLGPNAVGISDAIVAGAKISNTDDNEEKGDIVKGFFKSLSPLSKVGEAASQIGSDSPVMRDREGKETEISKTENLLRALGYTPASYIKAREFKQPPVFLDLLK